MLQSSETDLVSEIEQRLGRVAYRLKMPKSTSQLHPVFQVSLQYQDDGAPPPLAVLLDRELNNEKGMITPTATESASSLSKGKIIASRNFLGCLIESSDFAKNMQDCLDELRARTDLHERSGDVQKPKAAAVS